MSESQHEQEFPDVQVLYDLKITTQRVDAETFFGVPSEALPDPEVPYALLHGEYRPIWNGSKVERRCFNLLGTSGLGSDFGVELVAHLLSILDYDEELCLYRNFSTDRLNMRINMLHCQMGAVLTNSFEGYPCVAVLGSHVPIINHIYWQFIRPALAIACEEMDNHGSRYTSGFNLTVPVIGINHGHVWLFKVPVNKVVLKAVKRYDKKGKRPKTDELATVEVFYAGELCYDDVEARRNVIKYLEAFKRFAFDLNQTFADHRDPVAMEMYAEEEEFIESVYAGKPIRKHSRDQCTVDRDSLEVTTSTMT